MEKFQLVHAADEKFSMFNNQSDKYDQMPDPDHDSKIEKIAQLIREDKVPLDEQDPQKLAKYYDFAKTSFEIGDEQARSLVNEAFLYLMLQDAGDVDILQQGEKFGAGFS